MTVDVRNHRPRPGPAGFSAVELMIGIAFFGIMMVGLLSVFPLGVRSIQKGERISMATTLAQDELERIQTLDDADPDLLAGNHVDAANPLNGVYNRSWTITDDTPLPGMKQVDMTVTYSDNGIVRTITMTTYLNP